jgi:transposase
MMGTKERNFSPIKGVSLEELVPKDNFYRRLQETLDLSFVRELVKERYASSLGRPSVDPVVFFKLQLVLFFENLRSERQLMKVVSDRLSIRWYLGYDLNEPLPDHSSLTKIRERYGLEVFRRFFESIVEECFEAGLLWGEQLFFDSTKVKANADIDSLRSRSIAENHLKELFEETDHPEKKNIEDFFLATPHLLLSPEAAATDALPTAGDRALKENNEQKSKDWISREGSQERTFTSGLRTRTADHLMSTTDPDATPMRVNGGETKLGYQAHYVVDGGKARVILNVLVTPSEVSENRPMLDLLWRSAFRWHLWPHHVTGDAKYGTAEMVPQRTLRPSSGRTSGHLGRCTVAGASPTSLVEKASPTTRKRISMSAQPESTCDPWVRTRIAKKKIARGRLPPIEPRPHPAGRAS